MKKYIQTIIGFSIAIALIIIGICNNQQSAVLTKAAKICLECVGIG